MCLCNTTVARTFFLLTFFFVGESNTHTPEPVTGNVLSANEGVSITTITNGTEQHFSSWGSEQDPSLRDILVVPRLKFLFCFIPKNACTQFNRLMNELNGFVRQGDVCTPTDPNYISSWGNVMQKSSLKDVKALLKDPTWTKAVFLRDPLSRLVSGYQSECLPPQECGGCMNFEDANEKAWPDFDEFVGRLEYGHNPHFDPQVSSCGGLVDLMDDFDFVGEITTDYAGVSDQVRRMMDLVLHRDQASTFLARNISARSLADKFFAPAGPTRNASHHHVSTDVSEYFRKPATSSAALHHYRTDFNKLPGLKIPDWVATPTSHD